MKKILTEVAAWAMRPPVPFPSISIWCGRSCPRERFGDFYNLCFFNRAIVSRNMR